MLLRFDPLHVGMDFNVGKMAAICAEYYRRKLYVFHELVMYRDTPDIIQAVSDTFDDRKIITYPDASGVNRTSTDASKSDIALLRAAKFTVRAKPANPPVKDRIASVNKALEDGKLLIDTNNWPVLTEALEQQVYKDNGQPDKENDHDHPIDALGYMVYWLIEILFIIKRNSVYR